MKKYGLSIVSILLATILSVVFFPQLPNEIAIHWDAKGVADDFGHKAWIFLFPGIMFSLLLLKIFMPKWDPKKENYAKFSKSYHVSTETVMVFLLAVHIVSLLMNLGYNIQLVFVVYLALGLLFMILGNYLPKIQHNYFMGIRTPWTLASETVWQKTHRTGGKLFVLTGILMLLGLFLPSEYVWLSFTPILLVTISLIYLSYRYHQQEKNEG